MIKLKDRYNFFVKYFSLHQPEAETELDYSDPYELLVATILSAQCTDKRVNMITPAFYKRFPDAASLAKAELADVFELIRTCSYPNNKAKHLIGMSAMLMNDFNGIVPDNVDELQKLPGVGRKTANVIASVVFKKPVMAVDTHVFRVAARIGLTVNAKTPIETEKQLVKNIPEDKIAVAHHWLILHGRYICLARKPLCDKCGVSSVCRYYEKNKKL
jgi:endonuclease III